MKCAIILYQDIKQIVLTPENPREREALKYITPSDKIEMKVREGRFRESNYLPDGQYGAWSVGYCQAGYLREWEDSESVMLVLTPREPEPVSVKLEDGDIPI